MRLRNTLKIITWSAAALGALILIIGKDKDYAWIGVVVLAAVFLHFLIETVYVAKRGSFRRKLADLSQYKAHRQFLIKDLESTLSSGALLTGVSLPVVLSGTVTGPQKKAPLSGKETLAYRLVAEPFEGLAHVGAEVLAVDSYWGDMSLRDETGSVRIRGPGVLDGSSRTERIFTLKGLQEELPHLASRIRDGLGIKEGKDARSVRIALREIAVLPSEKVRVYATAGSASGKLEIAGTDVVDTPESLLVRAQVSPASSRIPRHALRAFAFGAGTAAAFAALCLFAYVTVISAMFMPGGIFDPTRTAPVSLDLDGRALRVSIDSGHWMLEQNDTTKNFALRSGGNDIQASRDSVVVVEAIDSSPQAIKNGDATYPRWDGSDWLFDAGATASVTPTAQTGTGRMYVRNLTGSSIAIRILDASGAPSDASWNFKAHEGAGDPSGSYLNLSAKGAVQVSGEDFVEIIVKSGSHRILRVSGVATWRQGGSWLLEIVPEYLAGKGPLYVRNTGDRPVNIWLLGVDGKSLYGEEPWTFDPKEGTTQDKGLALQYRDSDIHMTGRESIRVEYLNLRTIYRGSLQHIATWKNGTWTVDLSRIH